MWIGASEEENNNNDNHQFFSVSLSVQTQHNAQEVAVLLFCSLASAHSGRQTLSLLARLHVCVWTGLDGQVRVPVGAIDRSSGAIAGEWRRPVQGGQNHWPTGATSTCCSVAYRTCTPIREVLD